MLYKKCIKFSIGLIASVFFVYLVLRSVSIQSLCTALDHINLSWFLWSPLCLLGAYVFRIKRSQIMLASLNPDLSFGRSAVPYMVSVAANNVLPLRAGDALRAVNFSSWLNIPTVSILAVMMVERLMDLLVIIAALGLALFLFHPRSNSGDILLHGSSTFLMLLAIAIIVLLLFPAVMRIPTEWCLKELARIVPTLVGKLRPHTDKLFCTLVLMAHRPRMTLLFGYTGISWFLEACTFFVVAHSIPEIANPAAGWLAMPVGTLSTVLPSSPGYVGTFHYFVTIAAKSLGNTTDASTAFAILIHLVLWLPVTLCGALCFVYWIIKRNTVPAASSPSAR